MPNDTVCEFDLGVGGICTDGDCVDAMLCADAETRCDDGDDCTQNLCESAEGICSNPPEPDETVCVFDEGVGGECVSGVCVDAMLCADAATRCDDMNVCTDDDCDPADGICSHVAVPDTTECEFMPGVGGVCTAGACLDAMLCADAAMRCDDMNDCTDDDCDPADGMCSNVNLPEGSACDVTPLPEECDGAGACVATCTPTDGISVTFPTPSPTVSQQTYADVTNGFTISAVNCENRPFCELTLTSFGIGERAYGDAFAFDSNAAGNDSFLLSFFDQDGNPQNASNVSIILYAAGTSGTVDVLFDGVGPASFPAMKGEAIDLGVISAHDIEVTSTPGLFVILVGLEYDHACL